MRHQFPPPSRSAGRGVRGRDRERGRGLRRPGLGLLALFALALATLAAPALAQDDPAGIIRGRLTNGTPGGDIPAAVEVVLHVFRGDGHLEDRPGLSADDGSFVFEGLNSSPLYTYQVSASYAGAPYLSGAVRFAGETERSVDFSVYETTDADPGLSVRRASVVLLGVDAGSQSLEALEMITIDNPSDHAYLPNQSGPAGPMGLLRFSLPPHAGDLVRGPGLESAEIITVDRGFATTAPVPPGSNDFFFSYRFPYQAGRSRFMRSVPYPTSELQVIAPENGPTVEGPELQRAEMVEIGGRSYRRYTARELPAGSSVELTLADLPGRWPGNLPLDRLPALLWGGLSAGLALAVAAVAAWRFRQLQEPGAESPRLVTLIEDIVALDEAYAAGQLPEEIYQQRRAEARARLIRLMRGAPGALMAPDESGLPEPASGSPIDARMRVGAGGQHA